MSTDCQPPAASTSAAIEVSPPFSKRRLDRIDEPARPLGAKRAALQLRRQSAPLAAEAKEQRTGTGERTLASRDATVAFALRATAFGLLIERTQRQAVGTRLVQTMVFEDQPTFDRWCDSEPMRFEDPMLYDRLRREGHEALGGQR
ncbi:MAG: hypothetical protein IPM99_14380 [Rubrivivax sp.]|nr:hypothetical protein [Rubrivivax sp.]